MGYLLLRDGASHLEGRDGSLIRLRRNDLEATSLDWLRLPVDFQMTGLPIAPPQAVSASMLRAIFGER